MPKGRQSPSSSSSPTPSASSRVSRLAGMLMLIPALVSASPRAGQTDSVASAQPSQASFGPLMSGFVDQPSSPYHFGAKDPVYDPPPLNAFPARFHGGEVIPHSPAGENGPGRSGRRVCMARAYLLPPVQRGGSAGVS